MGKLNLYEELVKYDEFFALSQVYLNNLMLLNKSNGPFSFFLNTARLFHYYPKQLQK